MEPVPVKTYVLNPPETVIVGEPVVLAAAGKLSGYLSITTPDAPAVPVDPVPPPPPPPPVLAPPAAG